MGSKRGVFRYLDEELKIEDYKLEEALTDGEAMEQAYEDLGQKVKDEIEKRLQQEDSYRIDIGRMKMIRTAVDMLNGMSRRNQYQIPVEIEGESCLINLTVLSNTEEKGRFTLETDSEVLGKVKGDFRLNNEKLEGLLLGDTPDSEKILQEIKTELEGKFYETGIEKVEIQTGVWEKTNSKTLGKETNGESKTETRNLYKAAKIVIEQIVQKRGSI
jgi:hypothetical protein